MIGSRVITRDRGIEGGIFYLIGMLPNSVVNTSARVADVLGATALWAGVNSLFFSWEIECGVLLGQTFKGVTRVAHFAYRG